MDHPAVRRGRRRVLPLATVKVWGPCPEQYRKVATLADANGDIPLTRATLRKALTLGLDWVWFAERLGVNVTQAWADYHAAVRRATAAYRAAVAQADKAYSATVRSARAARDAAHAEACFRFLVEV